MGSTPSKSHWNDVKYFVTGLQPLTIRTCPSSALIIVVVNPATVPLPVGSIADWLANCPVKSRYGASQVWFFMGKRRNGTSTPWITWSRFDLLTPPNVG